MTLSDVERRIDGIDGWLSLDQVQALYEGATGCPAEGRIVEIGSFRGRSTIVLASAAPADAEIVAIDPHAGNDRGPQEIDGYEDAASEDRRAFERNLHTAGVGDRVRHIAKFSDDAHDDVDGPIDVLFIDGAHRFGPARRDIRAWGARVVDGGTLAIHDSFSSIGVTAAIAVELVPGRRFRYVGRARSLAIYRADLSASVGDRLRNAVKQLAQLPWFVRNVALKILLTAGLGRLLRRFGRAEPEWPY